MVQQLMHLCGSVSFTAAWALEAYPSLAADLQRRHSEMCDDCQKLLKADDNS